MSDQSKLGLGKIITDHQEKDAVHVAVAPVMAGHELRPGEHVGFLPDGTMGPVPGTIGVVDPFLMQQVQKGQKFWLFLYPGSITSLRHDWTHPAFDQGEPKLVTNSKKWMEAFAEDLGMFYDEVMVHAKNHRIKSGPMIGNFQSVNWDQFWNHYHIIIEGESK